MKGTEEPIALTVRSHCLASPQRSSEGKDQSQNQEARRVPLESLRKARNVDYRVSLVTATSPAGRGEKRRLRLVETRVSSQTVS